MKIEVPLGEVADRVTILRLKTVRLPTPQGRDAAGAHLALLEAAWVEEGLPELDGLPELADLAVVNSALWEVEDALRAHEATECFDAAFVALARRVYLLNDRRAALKRALDERLGSELREEKSYGPAGARPA